MIYYRINYRIADTFGITREEADRFHSRYHETTPRQLSQGFYSSCGMVVTIVPVICGIQDSDMEEMKAGKQAGF
ncbi:MAG TPA: hypothetical protein VNI77_03400 [Nitrososphaera sp.]|nr:hypothetical protein [Nitrososphaera sp.]